MYADERGLGQTKRRHSQLIGRICVNPRLSAANVSCLSQKAAELARTHLIAREDGLEVTRAEMLLGYLAKDIAKVGRQLQVSAFIQLIIPEAGPVGVDFAAAHAIADDKHRVGVTVIGASVAVLLDRATEFRHRQNHDIIHACSQISVEGCNCLTELSQQIAELSLLVALVDMRVPAADVSECHFQTDAGLDQLCDL